MPKITGRLKSPIPLIPNSSTPTQETQLALIQAQLSGHGDTLNAILEILDGTVEHTGLSVRVRELESRLEQIGRNDKEWDRRLETLTHSLETLTQVVNKHTDSRNDDHYNFVKLFKQSPRGVLTVIGAAVLFLMLLNESGILQRVVFLISGIK